MNINVSALNSKINKKSPFNLGGILCLVASIYLICHILIYDNFLPISISSMTVQFSHWAKNWHFLAVGLLPIYVAFMIFGAAIIGAYVGSTFHNISVFMFKKMKKNR